LDNLISVLKMTGFIIFIFIIVRIWMSIASRIGEKLKISAFFSFIYKKFDHKTNYH
jgi:hypothetical protein